MTQTSAALLGAIAGLTIFIGLPVARMRGLSRPLQGFLNAVATGVLVFLLWDILSHATHPVEVALGTARHGAGSGFWLLALLFTAGVAGGLLSLVYLNSRVLRRIRPVDGPPSPRRCP